MDVKLQAVPMERLGALTITGLLVATLSAIACRRQEAPADLKASRGHKTTLVKASQRARTRSGKTVHSRHAAAPSYQLHPDPERYQEIQKALADRGYFKGEANGVWGDDSVDAMKRFQTDQKLEDTDGKIDALSLIGLGLGRNMMALAPLACRHHPPRRPILRPRWQISLNEIACDLSSSALISHTERHNGDWRSEGNQRS